MPRKWGGSVGIVQDPTTLTLPDCNNRTNEALDVFTRLLVPSLQWLKNIRLEKKHKEQSRRSDIVATNCGIEITLDYRNHAEKEETEHCEPSLPAKSSDLRALFERHGDYDLVAFGRHLPPGSLSTGARKSLLAIRPSFKVRLCEARVTRAFHETGCNELAGLPQRLS